MASALLGGFLWGITLFLADRLADTRTFSTFVDRRGPWLADAVYALVEDEDVASEAAHHGLWVGAARWPRWAWLPIPEARMLRHAVAHARRRGHPPKIGVAAFLIDVAGHAPSDVARSLVWPTSIAGVRTGRRRQLTHEVSRTWFGRGPQRWAIDVEAVVEGRRRRVVRWEAGFLAVIVIAILVGLVALDRLLAGW